MGTVKRPAGAAAPPPHAEAAAGRTRGPDFDAMFAASDDPWSFRSRWYERRKRALTLAALPAERYGSAYEPGCANGELAALLAPRCDRLLASDGSPRAVALARERLSAWPGARVIHANLPEQWPEGECFDLIVLSEWAYYLSPLGLAATIRRVLASLADGGTVLACHWRPRIDTCTIDGDEVDRFMEAALGLPRLSAWVDDDFRLSVWCRDARSPAQLEGLR